MRAPSDQTAKPKSERRKGNPFLMGAADEARLYAAFRREARARQTGDVRAAALLSNLVLEVKRTFMLPTRHLLTGEDPATVETALQILFSDSLLLRTGGLRVMERTFEREWRRVLANRDLQTLRPSTPLQREATAERITTELRLQKAATFTTADAADVLARLLSDAKRLTTRVAKMNEAQSLEIRKAKALGDRRALKRIEAANRQNPSALPQGGMGSTLAKLLHAPVIQSTAVKRSTPGERPSTLTTSGARPTLSTLPLDVLEDGHVVLKIVRSALGLVTHVLRIEGPIPDAIDDLLQEIATVNGLVDEDHACAANLRRNGAPILFIDELTTLTRKLVYDLWTAERRLAVILTASDQADRPLENPFATLRIPLLRDRNRQLMHAYAVRTIPTLVEPIVGGVRLTAATGFADLRGKLSVAVPPWVRTFAQMGAVRRWTARSYDKTFAESLEAVVRVTADRMPREERRRFFENILELIDLPVEEPTALIPVSNLELDRLRQSRKDYTEDIAKLRTLVSRKLVALGDIKTMDETNESEAADTAVDQSTEAEAAS